MQRKLFCQVDAVGDCALVVGAGAVARRKVLVLARAGMSIRVLAPKISPQFREEMQDFDIRYIEAYFDPSRCEAVDWVVAATDDRATNRAVLDWAKQIGAYVNVADDAAASTFTLPAVIDRWPIEVAVSSNGASPLLTRLVRSKIEATVPAAVGKLAHLMSLYRDKVKAKIADVHSRRRFWQTLLEGPIAEAVFSGNLSEAETKLDRVLLADAMPDLHSGEVYLVGAGPGDPDLLTFKALRLMQKADVVLYDNLVSKPIRDLVRADAERVYVGKRSGNHVMPQEQITALLVQYAMAGKRVLRLKGGDPFIFGRGGEEIEGLFEHKIPFQVVPGITAASGCAAYAGIPLTHRDYSQSVRFVTGHLARNGDGLPWAELADPQQTVVFYMGLAALENIVSQLVAQGLHESMPIALIQNGTLPEQLVAVGTLATIVEDVRRQGFVGPSLIILGEVVRLRDRLSWFDGNQTPAEIIAP